LPVIDIELQTVKPHQTVVGGNPQKAAAGLQNGSKVVRDEAVLACPLIESELPLAQARVETLWLLRQGHLKQTG